MLRCRRSNFREYSVLANEVPSRPLLTGSDKVQSERECYNPWLAHPHTSWKRSENSQDGGKRGRQEAVLDAINAAIGQVHRRQWRTTPPSLRRQKVFLTRLCPVAREKFALGLLAKPPGYGSSKHSAHGGKKSTT